MSVDLLEPIEVFYSYAQKDDALCKELDNHLGALKQRNLIRIWHKRDIQIGADWTQEVDIHLNTAHLILLLISSDFMASDYCCRVVMQRALERHEQRNARVIPILLRPVNLGNTPIASLPTLPRSGKPITSWSNRDAALADVAKDIEKVIWELKAASASSPPKLSLRELRSSHGKTIDTDEIISRFQHLLQSTSNIRVLRLVGEAKMGKSHLLTKVFPSLVEQDDRTRYAILDMRNRMHAVPDILDQACSFLGWENFDFYSAACHEWNSRLQGKTRPNQSNQGGQSISEQTQARDRHLTLQFVRDLSQVNDKLLLFLFDNISNTNKYMKYWLVSIFLPHVSQIVHVRTVVAGRSPLPDVDSSYTLFCEDYQLKAVTNVDDYITYCRELNALLEEQSIRDFAHACDYTPGMFVELVYPKFMKGKDIR